MTFDINPVQNIFIKYDKDMNEIYRVPKNGKYDKNISGTLTPENPLVGHMKNLGWKWEGIGSRRKAGLITNILKNRPLAEYKRFCSARSSYFEPQFGKSPATFLPSRS